MASVTTPEFRARLKAALAAAFGDRFRGVILFGSEARGEATVDSDVDLMILLVGPVSLFPDIVTAVQAIYPLQLELVEHPIHMTPVAHDDFEKGDHRFYRNVQREGFRL